MASSGSQTEGAPVSCGTVKYTCIGCGDECTMEDSVPGGGRGSISRIEKVCKAILSKLYDKKSTSEEVRKAYKDKPKDAKMKYIKSKKMQKLKSQEKYNFDDISVEENARNTSGHELRGRIHWYPYAVFEKKELEDAIKDHDLDVSSEGAMEMFRTDCKEAWDNKLKDAKYKRLINDDWHVGEHLGYFEDSVEGDYVDSNVKKRASVTQSAEGMKSFVEASQQLHKKLRTGMSEAMQQHVPKGPDVSDDVKETTGLDAGEVALKAFVRDTVRDLARKIADETAIDEVLLEKEEQPTPTKLKPLWSLKLAINTMKSKLKSSLQSKSDELTAHYVVLKEDIEASNNLEFDGKEEYLEEVQTQLGAIDADIDSFKKGFESISAEFEELTSDLSTAEIASDALQNLKALPLIAECSKLFKQAKKSLAECRKTVDECTKTTEKLETSADLPADVKDGSDDKLLATRMVKEFSNEIPKQGGTCQPSNFVARQTAVLVNSSALKACAEKIYKAEFMQKNKTGMLALLAGSMRGKSDFHAAGAIVDSKGIKLVQECVAKEFNIPVNLTHRHVDVKSMEQLFEYCVYMHKPGQKVLAFTHYALAECRLHMAGVEVVLGWRYSEIPGDKFSAKLICLNLLTVEKAVELSQKIGFCLTQKDAGDLAIIPAGYMVATITLGQAPTTVLRWSFSQESESASRTEAKIVHSCLAQLIEAYPSLTKKFHGKVLKSMEGAAKS